MAKNAKKFLQGRGSWQRDPRGPKNVVWNLEDGTIASLRSNTSDIQLPSSVATS